MAEIDRFRRLPEFARLTDVEIAGAVSQRLNEPMENIARELGVTINAPGIASTFKRMGGSMIQGAGEIARDLGWENNPISEYGRGLAQANPSGINSLEDVVNNPLLAVQEAAATGVSFMGPQIGARLGGLALATRGGAVGTAGRAIANPYIGGAALTSLPSIGSIGEEQRAAGRENLPLKYGAGALIGGIEQLGGPQRWLGGGIRRQAEGALSTGLPRASLEEFRSSPLRTFGSVAGRMGAQEAGEEILQSPIEQVAGYRDPLSRQSLEETALGGVMGGIGGVLPFGVASGARRAWQQGNARQFVGQTLNDPAASFRSRLDAAQIQRQFVTSEQGPGAADAWYDSTMRGIYAEEQDRIASGERYDLMESLKPSVVTDTLPTADFINQNVGLRPQQERNDLLEDARAGFMQPLASPTWITDEDGQPQLAKTEFDLYDYYNRNPAMPGAPRWTMPYGELQPTDQPFQAFPHAAPVQATGAYAEPAINRALSVVAALQGREFPANSQEARDYAWAQDFLNRTLGTARADSVLGEVTSGRTPPPKRPAGAATRQGQLPLRPQSYGDGFRAAGGFASNSRKALDAAKTDQEALQVVRDTLERPNIASSTIRALETLHVQIAGETYEIYKRRQEAADAVAGRQDPKAPGAVTTVPVEKYQAPRPEPQPAAASYTPPAEWAGWSTSVSVSRQVAKDLGIPITTPSGNLKSQVDLLGEIVRRIEQGRPLAPPAAVPSTAAMPSAPGATSGVPEGRPDRGAPLMHTTRAGPAAAEDIADQDPSSVAHFLLEKLGERNKRYQVVIEAQIGVTNGVARDNAEIAKQLGISKERVRQVGEQARKAMKQLMAEYKIDESMFRGGEQEPEQIGPEDARSTFGVRMDVAALGAALTKDDAGNVEEIEGFKVRPENEVNSSNIVGEVVMGRDGQPTREFHVTGDRQANERARLFERAAAEGDVAAEAAVTWDAFAHIQTAEGEKVRSWSELEQSDRGRQTQKDWVAFYTKSKQSQRPDIEQVRALRAAIKERYYSRLTPRDFDEEVGALTWVTIHDHPMLARALIRWFDRGLGQVVESYVDGFYVSEHGNRGWDALAFNDDEVDTPVRAYSIIFNNHFFSGKDPAVTDAVFERVVHHEIAHAIDDAVLEDGVYSDTDSLYQAGKVYREILRGVTKDTWISNAFDYPIRYRMSSAHGRKELFAQIMSAYYTPELSARLAEKLPTTFAFAETAHERIRQEAEGLAAYLAQREVLAGGQPSAPDRKTIDPAAAARQGGIHGREPQEERQISASQRRLGPTVFAVMSDTELEATVVLLKEKLDRFTAAAEQVPVGEYTEAQVQLKAAVSELERRSQARRRDAAGFAPQNKRPLHSQRTPDRPPDASARAMTTVANAWAKYKPTVLTLHQLIDQFGEKLPSLREYVAAMDRMSQRQQEIAQGAHQLLLDWQALPTWIKDSLHKVMQRATLRGIHPDELFGAGTPNAHVQDRAEYDAVKSRFDGLPAAAKAVYKSARRTLEANWNARKLAFDRATSGAYQKLIDEAADPAEAAALTSERDGHIAAHDRTLSSVKGPYFPLLRFGDYLTIAHSSAFAKLEKDLESATGPEHTAVQKQLERMKRQPDHYVVEAHETRQAAERSAAQHSAKGRIARTQLGEEHFRALQPVAAGAIDRISQSISSQFDRKTADKMKRLVTDLYISSLPEHAALQRQLRRIGVEGATQDMLRAVAKSIEKDAFHLARMEYADEIASNLFKLKTEAKDAGIDHQHVYNNVAARLALDFQYKPTPIQNMLARMSGIWHLGMSPAYIFTNSTQPWMITAPVLAGKFGLGRSLMALRAAWVDAARAITQSKRGGGAFADLDVKAIANADERKAVEHVLRHGQIDINQTTDMGLIADGTDPRFLKLHKVFNWANHHVEASNRLTTALAAYRLSRQTGVNHNAATEYALKMVVDTQLDYSDANAAYWMKLGAVPLGRLIFQFRRYQQGMIYLMARNAQLAFKGDKDALRSLGYLAAMQLAFAGAVGIPVVTAPLAALSLFMGGGDDEEGSLETQLRNYLADLMGPEAARAFWKGLPTLMGLDVAQRVGMGDMWKPLPFLRLDRAKTGEESAGRLAIATLGAPVGMLARMWDGAKLMEAGNWQKGAEKLLPKMFADVVKAERYADEGLTTRAGMTVLRPDRIDGWDIAFRAAGFSPVVETEHYAAQQSKENISQAIKERRAKVLREYATTKLGGQETAGARAAIEEFNKVHPSRGLRIDLSAMLQAVQARRKAAAELDEAGVRFRRNEGALQGITRYARP